MKVQIGRSGDREFDSYDSFKFDTYSSNRLKRFSRRINTCTGSRTELHAVKPAISPNITVQSGNNSAIGLDLRDSSDSSVDLLMTKASWSMLFTRSFRSELGRLSGTPSSGLPKSCARTVLGKRDRTILLVLAAAAMTLELRRLTYVSYVKKAMMMPTKTHATIMAVAKGVESSITSRNCSEGNNCTRYWQ